MNIEPAAQAQAPAISELIRRLSPPFLLSPDGAGAEPFFASISEEAIRGFVVSPQFVYRAATLNGRLAGVVAMRDHNHLFHLFVDTDFQQQGLGRRLWESARAHAIGAAGPEAFTVNSSLNAVPVYASFGFEVTGAIVRTHGVAFQPMRLERARVG